ncbi:MAG TPA: hypothetical protein DIV86_04655 [Alphaproteobacteria bacterium]|nr:hypothetical protein [Alphaproteobacteria bacterium]
MRPLIPSAFAGRAKLVLQFGQDISMYLNYNSCGILNYYVYYQALNLKSKKLYRGSLERLVIIYVAIKTFFIVIWEFFLWFITSRVTIFFFALGVVISMVWSFGLYSFQKDINIDLGEMMLNTPAFMERTDAIIVLTGGSERMRHALYMLDKGAADKLFISGVNKEVKKHEIFALHKYSAKKFFKLQNKVFLGYSASDTIENAEEIKNWVRKNKINSFRLVTSNYHIKRAQIEISHLLPDVKIIPHQVLPINVRFDKWWEFENSRRLIVTEYNKYLLARIRISLEDLGFKNTKALYI